MSNRQIGKEVKDEIDWVATKHRTELPKHNVFGG